MHLVIFDIDGTLIRSHDQEADCFIKAVSEVTGITQISRELRAYEHVTDTGIANECIHRYLHRLPTAQETLDIERRFLTHFQAALEHSDFTLIAGVEYLFEKLSKLQNMYFAIATGSYYASAILKLTSISPSLISLPIASANDSQERTKIMLKAVENTKRQHNEIDFETITYIGDGPWDIAAVKALRWSFIGIASHYSKEKLQEWGAKWIISDYLSHQTFIDYLMEARLSYGS